MALIELQGINKSFGTKDKKVRVMEVLESLGIADLKDKYPNVCDRTIFLDKH